jgi:hydrogenase expression/formation protein HypC
MCLAIPGKILKIKGQIAKVDFDGIEKEINVALIEDIKAGEYVMVHAGFAIEKMEAEQVDYIHSVIGKNKEII